MAGPDLLGDDDGYVGRGLVDEDVSHVQQRLQAVAIALAGAVEHFFVGMWRGQAGVVREARGEVGRNMANVGRALQ